MNANLKCILCVEDEPEMIDLIQRRTRQFAKRQHTWFRNLEECRAVEIQGDESPAEIAERILQTAGP